MILTSLKNNICIRILVVLVVAILFPSVPKLSLAQTGGLSLSVSPTLFQMSAVPGQAWNSGVKVVNNNPQELTVYAQVVNFAPQGEAGEGKFIPVLKQSTEGATLAEWITISREPIVIAPEQTVTVPFTVAVPESAAPGGHFAAILIGTRPPASEGTVRIATSQIVSSLFFVRIAGDVNEAGAIREFTTKKRFVDSPKADIEVRFENKGNVHLQPQGEIVITNMWGKERGVIPINHQTHFGNVLPSSIRKFEFSWTGEQSFTDIGRYKATLSLGYGSESKKFDSSVLYFYVVPVKATALFIFSIIATLLIVRWSVKAYIHRVLITSGIDPYTQKESSQRSFLREGDIRIVRKIESSKVSERSPLREYILTTWYKVADVSSSLYHVIRTRTRLISLVSLAVVPVCILLLFVYRGLTDSRDYEVTISNPDTEVTLSSEEILYNEISNNDQQRIQKSDTNQRFSLSLINSSDTPGAGADLRSQIEERGYGVSRLESDLRDSKEKTVIVYTQDIVEEALNLSKILGGALLSAHPSATTTASIEIYIGNDFVKNTSR